MWADGAHSVCCASCDRPVSKAVIDYCRANAERFGERVSAIGCQRPRAGGHPIVTHRGLEQPEVPGPE